MDVLTLQRCMQRRILYSVGSAAACMVDPTAATYLGHVLGGLNISSSVGSRVAQPVAPVSCPAATGWAGLTCWTILLCVRHQLSGSNERKHLQMQWSWQTAAGLGRYARLSSSSHILHSVCYYRSLLCWVCKLAVAGV